MQHSSWGKLSSSMLTHDRTREAKEETATGEYVQPLQPPTLPSHPLPPSLSLSLPLSLPPSPPST